MPEGGAMFRNLDDQIQQSKRHSVRLTRQLLGVLGEEEYFARQEAERRRKLAKERQREILVEERERQRVLHLMRCPKCGMQLEENAFGNVRIDKCFSCEGLWLDKGEMDLIRQKEGGFVGRMLSVFG
jgi:hypothetical protein